MTTAFVFAGGGSLGAVQVGALQELLRAGVQPDLVVGASVGAMNACFFAAQPNEDGAAALATIWRGLRRQDVFPITIRGALSWLRGGDSIFDSTALRAMIAWRLPIKNIEDAALPAHVVATDLSGAAVCLSRGPAIDAILASAAIPIALPSVQIGASHLIDGAIAGNTPVVTAAELGATRIIVLQTGYACSLSGPPRGAVARGMHALTLLISNQLERDLRLLDGRVEVHVTPHLCPLDVSPFNFDHSSELIERSAQLTRAWLDSGGLNKPVPPDVVRHDHAAMPMRTPFAGGYDLVSYFEGEPLLGLTQFSAEHDGRLYLFASNAHRDAFLLDPARFQPEYGGACAWAMAQGKSVEADPRCYHKTEDGRLFFNLNEAIQKKWEMDMASNIERADMRWRSRRG